ncbi:MAG: polysaccharide biosynthesis protein [Clostridia bacterium]|nr:polysaccharide biosynthesis protein [Clostridia bacterium]
MTKNTKKNFMSGAVILMVALAAVKVIGFIYKIPLTNLLKGDGLGYYNDAYQIYSLLFVLSTGGLPVAIAKLVSESNAVGRIHEPKKILSLSLKAFSVVGLVGMLTLIFISHWFANVVTKTPGSTISIIAIAPAIFFVSLGAAFKGFFQGYKEMTPTAIYQILEAAAKLLGLGIVFVLIAMGKTDASVLSCGAILGVTFGSFVSTTFMFLRFYFGKEPIDTTVTNPIENRSNSVLFKAILKIAIPVTLSSSILSIASFIDLISVKQALANSGLPVLSPEEIETIKETTGVSFVTSVNSVYGAYTGCCGSLFNLPPTITQTIGISVLPFISELFSLGKKKEAYQNMDSSMRIVSLIAAPCAIGMSFFAYPILMLLYGGLTEEVIIATPTFHVLALGIYLVAIVYPTNIFLQATGKQNIPIVSMLVGAILKLVTNYVLVSNPSIRINGVPFGTLLCYGTILIINLIMLYKLQKYKPDIVSVFIKPLLAAVISIGGSYLIYRFVLYGNISIKLCAIIGIAIAAVLYVLTVFAIKAINKEDILLLPGGNKIANILTSKGIIK